MQVLYLGGALSTKETLPDFMKWGRVTRHPLVFRRLTGSQRTPGFRASHSMLYGDRLVGIRRVKNESSYTQQGLHVGTENMGFFQGFKQGVREIKIFRFRKYPRDFLEFLICSKR